MATMAQFYDYQGEELRVTDTIDLIKKFEGKNIIILADSIFDYEQPDGFNIGEYIHQDINANVYNWAQGGCMMAKGKADNYDPYSFVGMVDALCTRNFTDQEKYMDDRGFTDRVTEMEKFDMSKCDYMIVSYGTNDLWLNTQDDPTDNANNELDTSTFLGAYRYGIKTLLTKYPTIKLLSIGFQGGMGAVNGKTGVYHSAKKWNEALKDISYDLSIPFLNMWSHSMINSYTQSTLTNGQPHLKKEGKKRYAALIENALNYYY